MSISSSSEFLVRFHGVRGSLAIPGVDFLRAGGNTSCVELRCGERLVVLDAGTGIRGLGKRLAGDGERFERIDLLVTHGHYDHIEGLPFFSPLYDSSCRVEISMGRVDGADGVSEAISGLMEPPRFPVRPDVFRADIRYRTLEEHETLDLGDGIFVRTCPLNHPGGATGYRIEYAGRSFCYVTDTEHVADESDSNILGLIGDCDLFGYDCTFTESEMSEYSGYGHSTWSEGLRLRSEANASAMLALHHAPFRTDAQLDEIEAEIKANHSASGVAREGDCIHLRGDARVGA